MLNLQNLQHMCAWMTHCTLHINRRSTSPSSIWQTWVALRHDEIAREILEASKVAANDTTKEFAITFFDDKLSSLTPLQITYFLQ